MNERMSTKSLRQNLQTRATVASVETCDNAPFRKSPWGVTDGLGPSPADSWDGQIAPTHRHWENMRTVHREKAPGGSRFEPTTSLL